VIDEIEDAQKGNVFESAVGGGDPIFYPADLIRLILKWKWVSLACLLVPLLATVVIINNKTPVYESRVLLKISPLPGVDWVEAKWIEYPETLTARLAANYPKIDHIELKGGRRLINIFVRALSPKGTTSSIDKIIGTLIEDHRLKLTEIQKVIQARMKNIEVERKNSEQLSYTMRRRLENVVKESDTMGMNPKQSVKSNEAKEGEPAPLPPVTWFKKGGLWAYKGWLTIEQQTLVQKLMESKKSILSLKRDYRELSWKRDLLKKAHTIVLAGPTKPKKVLPRPKLLGALALLFGIALAIIVPMGAEFITGKRAGNDQVRISDA
jgi:hypothetical protein